MRNLLLALSIGIATLLIGGTTFAFIGVALVAPLAATLLRPSAGRPPQARGGS